jgi:catalase
MQWDFWTLSPESAHQVMILMSDRGTPRTWRHQHGFSSHTYSWINAGEERFWVKYRWKTVQGIENFTDAEAKAMTAEDPDFHRRDLWESIARREAFDLTKVWPHGDYPEIEVGRMVLDRNPENFFAEVEQAGFNPSNLVPGTGLSPDKMLMARIFSYHDTHLHRIGPNYEQLPINAPKSSVHSYNKDGAMTYRHSGNQPVYAPNSSGGPQADPEHGSDLFWHVPEGELGRYAYEKHAEDDDFGQPGTLYREVMNDTEREHLVNNIVGHASNEVTPEMQARVVAYWSNIDAELGSRVAAGLGHGDGASTNGGVAEARELLATRANRA